MDLTKYYPDIAAKYPAYVTQRELCEICRICPKTAYNLEQQGEIPYTIEQNHLIRSHKIKLTDILAYLYRRECRQEADSPYICAMRTFYDKHLSPYSDLLSVKDIQQITGFSSSAIVRWISIGILKAFQPGKQYTVPKDFMLDFLILGYVFLLWERLLVGGQGYSSAARGYGCLFRFRKANHGKTPLKRAF